MNDPKRKDLFDRWITLKWAVQGLAGIVQNPMEHITHEDGVQWLNDYEKFQQDLQQLKKETMEMLP